MVEARRLDEGRQVGKKNVHRPDAGVIDLVHTETSLSGKPVSITRPGGVGRTKRESPSRVGCNADKGACDHTIRGKMR